jgi:hypothetical protein
MRFSPLSKEAFEGYTPALRALESSFRKAGLGISFLGFDSPVRGKVVCVKADGKIVNSVTIEDDNPAQAIKNVAQAVDCSWTRKSKGGAAC